MSSRINRTGHGDDDPTIMEPSREAHRWFASILVDTADVRPAAHAEAAVGVDLGIAPFATLSTGETFPSLKVRTGVVSTPIDTHAGQGRD